MSDTPIAKPMNSAQLKYARELLDNAKRNRLVAIKAKHTVLGVKLDFEQTQVALCEGRIVANKARPYYVSSDPGVRNLVDFTDETDTVVDHASILTETQALEDAYTKARDELVLGSAPAALELIREFTKA